MKNILVIASTCHLINLFLILFSSPSIEEVVDGSVFEVLMRGNDLIVQYFGGTLTIMILKGIKNICISFYNPLLLTKRLLAMLT